MIMYPPLPSWTTVFMHKGIVVYTRSVKCHEKLYALGFSSIFHIAGWKHHICAEEYTPNINIVWAGSAKKFFSKKNANMRKMLLATLE
jgi:hypothetical protein